MINITDIPLSLAREPVVTISECLKHSESQTFQVKLLGGIILVLLIYIIILWNKKK
jgi:hypothetical protein